MPDTSVVEITDKDISANSGEPRKRPPKRKRASIWHDPVATGLAFGIALVIIGALLAAILAVINGAVSLGATPPATLKQALLQNAQESVASSNDADGFTQLITTQVDNGDIPGAQVTLAQAKRQDFDLTQNEMINYSQAYIYQHSGKTAEAIKLYQQVMATLKKNYEDEKAKGGDTNWAIAFGLPENYYNSASLLSDIFQQEKDWNNVVKYLNIWLGGKPTDASAMIDRGNAYLELGQKDKAKQDFQNALKFTSDGDANAVAADAGLKKAEGN